MELNPEINDRFIINTICSLSSQDRYFIAYYDSKGYYKANFPKMKPHFIVYREEQVKTMKDLMDKFLEKHKQFEQLKDGMAWELQTGTRISPKLTLDDFKIGLRKEKIDGTKIFVYEKKGEWSDESAVMSYLCSSQQCGQDQYLAPFVVEDVQYHIYLPLNPKSIVAHAKQSLQKQIQRILAASVDINNIEIFIKKQNNIVPALNTHLSRYIGSQKQKFIVRFKTKVPLKMPAKQNNFYIMICGEGIEKNIIFEYDTIKNRKLINVIDQLIPNKKLKKMALALQGQLLRFNQPFSKFQKLFKNSFMTTGHFIGHLINEGLAFQYSYKNLMKMGQVDFQKILSKQKINLERRRNCDQFSKNKAQSAKKDHFKNIDHVSIIAYYTSEIKVLGSNQKESQTIYGNLNKYMRENDFCDAEKFSTIDNWEYKFAAHLYHQIKQIDAVQQKQILWRGVGYDYEYKKGEQIYFQQFNSTSTNKKQAINFATTSIFMIINPKSAHPIKQFSVQQYQDQALMEPFTNFLIKEVWKLSKTTIQQKSNKDLKDLNQKTYSQWRAKEKKNQFTLNLIICEEMEKPKMPQMKSTVFLWVDDKTGEGQQIWSKIESIKNTTVMIQLLTTAQLENWLSKHQKMVKDRQIELVMITNMTRVEGGKKEDKAGVYAIDTFYKHKPKGTVFVYIGWLQGTLNKLKEHNYFPQKNLLVSDDQQDIVSFLKEKGLKRKS